MILSVRLKLLAWPPKFSNMMLHFCVKIWRPEICSFTSRYFRSQTWIATFEFCGLLVLILFLNQMWSKETEKLPMRIEVKFITGTEMYIVWQTPEQSCNISWKKTKLMENVRIYTYIWRYFIYICLSHFNESKWDAAILIIIIVSTLRNTGA